MKEYWIMFTKIVGGLAIIGALFTFSDRYVTRDLLSMELKTIDQKVAQSLSDVNKTMQLQFNANRFTTLTDQEQQLKLFLRKSPKDMELQDELRRVQEDKEKVRREMR